MKSNQREKTKPVFVKDIQIGGNNNVVIQSMTTTKTHDVDATMQQINELIREGCQIVRVAVLDQKDCDALQTIVQKASCPIVADIHFNPFFAIGAIKNKVHKIRINPGNIQDPKILQEIVKLANQNQIPIRIGVNSGSLPTDLFKKYGVCAKSMVMAAKRHVQLFEENGFNNIVISLKATDPLLAIEAYQKAAKTFVYPLHIGITESGSLLNGTIKSAAGLGVLLYQGIGNTIRISLTGDPRSEIKVCKRLLNAFGLYQNVVDVIACPTCGRLEFELEKVVKEIENFTKKMQFPLKIAILGCNVNGPGEAREADIGIAGGKGTGIIFADGKILKRVQEDLLVPELKKLILAKKAAWEKKQNAIKN